MGVPPLQTLRRAPTRRAEACAQRALAAIQSRRKLIWHLHAIGHLWFTPASCFGVPERASPSAAGLREVAALTTHSNVNVAIAALVALRSAAVALTVADTPLVAYAEVRGPLAEALSDPRALVRIAASRVLAEAPCREGVELASALLSSDVYTVRWNAIVALAGAGSTEGLRAALREAAPRDVGAIAAATYAQACAAVELQRGG